MASSDLPPYARIHLDSNMSIQIYSSHNSNWSEAYNTLYTFVVSFIHYLILRSVTKLLSIVDEYEAPLVGDDAPDLQPGEYYCSSC